MTARSDLANSFETTLTTQMEDDSKVAVVDSKGTLSSPCILVIEPDKDAQREFILFNGTFGGSSFVCLDEVNDRYLPGSAAGSGLIHPAGSIVSSIMTQQHLEHLWTAIENDISDFAAHDGGTDVADHPESTSSVRGFMSAADKEKLDESSLGFLHEEVDDDDESGTQPIPLTETDVATATLLIPTHWTSWKCEASAQFDYEYIDSDRTNVCFFEARIRIDGSDSATRSNFVISNIDPGFQIEWPRYSTSFAASRSGMTTVGSRTVSLRLDVLNGDAGNDAYNIRLYARAIRTS